MENTRERLVQLMDEQKLTQAQVAKGLGRSASSLSQYLSGSYKGDHIGFETDVESFIKKQMERSRQTRLRIPFVFTINAKTVFNTCRLCHLGDEIGAVIGDPGSGKTFALRHYAELNPDVIFIEADMTYTAKILMQEIGRRLKVDVGGSLHEIFDSIVDKLKTSHRLIIVDEGEHLPFRAMDLLRRIKDKADAGIILAGTRVLLSNLRGRNSEYAQLYSRVGIATELSAITDDDFKQLVTEVFGNDEFAELIAELTHRNGRSFEYLVKRINNIRKDQPLTQSIIKQAAKLLIH